MLTLDVLCYAYDTRHMTSSHTGLLQWLRDSEILTLMA